MLNLNEIDGKSVVEGDHLIDSTDGLDGSSEVLEDVTPDCDYSDLKAWDFSGAGIQDFTAMFHVAAPPDSGEYEFKIDPRFLRMVVKDTKLVQTVARTDSYSLVRVTVFNDKIRFSAVNQISFCETFAPLLADCGLATPISFVFDNLTLERIAVKFRGNELTFRLSAGKSLLRVNGSGAELTLSTKPDIGFPAYINRIGIPEYVGELDCQEVRRALGYLSNFSKRDDAQLNLSVIDCRDGMVIGGSHTSLGVYEGDKFKGLTFRVKHELIKVMDQILINFEIDKTHLFVTENFWIIRDNSLAFGFERTEYKFPPIDAIYKAQRSKDVLVIPRHALNNALNVLSIVSTDREFPVKCKVQGVGDSSSLDLSVMDDVGRVSSITIPCGRFPAGAENSGDVTYEDQEFNVVLRMLNNVTTHFSTPNAFLQLIPGKFVVLIDQEVSHHATSMLPMLSDSVIQDRRAVKAGIRAKKSAEVEAAQ